MTETLVDFEHPFLKDEMSVRKVPLPQAGNYRCWWQPKVAWGKAEVEVQNGQTELLITVDSLGLRPGKYEGHLKTQISGVTFEYQVRFEVAAHVTGNPLAPHPTLTFNPARLVLPTIHLGDSSTASFVINKEGPDPYSLEIKWPQRIHHLHACNPADRDHFPKTVSMTVDTAEASFTPGQLTDVFKILVDGVEYEVPVSLQILPALTFELELFSPGRAVGFVASNLSIRNNNGYNIEINPITEGSSQKCCFGIRLSGPLANSVFVTWEGNIPPWATYINIPGSSSPALVDSGQPFYAIFTVKGQKTGVYTANIIVDISASNNKRKQFRIPVTFRVNPHL